MSVRLSGRLIEVRLEQPEKAPSPMAFKVAGSETVFRLEQPEKV